MRPYWTRYKRNRGDYRWTYAYVNRTICLFKVPDVKHLFTRPQFNSSYVKTLLNCIEWQYNKGNVQQTVFLMVFSSVYSHLQSVSEPICPSSPQKTCHFLFFSVLCLKTYLSCCMPTSRPHCEVISLVVVQNPTKSTCLVDVYLAYLYAHYSITIPFHRQSDVSCHYLQSYNNCS